MIGGRRGTRGRSLKWLHAAQAHADVGKREQSVLAAKLGTALRTGGGIHLTRLRFSLPTRRSTSAGGRRPERRVGTALQASAAAPCFAAPAFPASPAARYHATTSRAVSSNGRNRTSSSRSARAEDARAGLFIDFTAIRVINAGCPEIRDHASLPQANANARGYGSCIRGPGIPLTRSSAERISAIDIAGPAIRKRAPCFASSAARSIPFATSCAPTTTHSAVTRTPPSRPFPL